MQKAYRLAVVDDHKLFRRGLVSLIDMVDKNSEILFEADNGEQMKSKLDPENLPDIVLMDVNMPGMDGFASVAWLKENHPAVRVLVVSMIEKEETVVRMLKLGVKGYLCKDVEPEELGEALHAVLNKGFYYTDFITGKLVHSLQNESPGNTKEVSDQINDREREFIKLACSEMTYNEIADKMCLSPKTIDGYRNSLFEKLNIKSRVGLVIYAIRHGIFRIDGG